MREAIVAVMFSCVFIVKVRFKGDGQFNYVDFSVGEEQDKIRTSRCW